MASEQSSEYILWERKKVEDLVMSEFAEGLAELSDSELMDVLEKMLRSRRSNDALDLWGMVGRPSLPSNDVDNTATAVRPSATSAGSEGLGPPEQNGVRWPWEDARPGTDSMQQLVLARPEADMTEHELRSNGDDRFDVRAANAVDGDREASVVPGVVSSEHLRVVSAAAVPEPRGWLGKTTSVQAMFTALPMSLSQKLCALGEAGAEEGSLQGSAAGALSSFCDGGRTARALLSALAAGLGVAAFVALSRGLTAALRPAGVLVGKLLAKVPQSAKDHTAEKPQMGGEAQTAGSASAESAPVSLWERARGTLSLGGGSSSISQRTGARVPPVQLEEVSAAPPLFPEPGLSEAAARSPGFRVTDPRLRKLLDNGPPSPPLPGANPMDNKGAAAPSSFGPVAEWEGGTRAVQETQKTERFGRGLEPCASSPASYRYQERQGDAPVDVGPWGQQPGVLHSSAGIRFSADVNSSTDNEGQGCTPPDPWAAARGP